jgi:transposase InsO family protein
MGNFTATHEVSFMIRDLMALETHEKIMLDIDEEQRADRRAEELTIAQRNFDQELLQMQQDIDDDTQRFISAFESLDHDDSDTKDECYDRLIQSRETYFRNRDLPSADRNNEPDSDDDDLLENTDTEDGADEFLDLLQSNRQMTRLLSQHSRDARLRDHDVLELLPTNTHLVALLSTQRKTIARLRARINRLGTLIPQLPSHDIGNSNTMMDAAFILTDSLASTPEVTLSSIGSKFNPEIHLNFLMNKKVHQELQRKQASLHDTEDDMPQLWMYFDSGASRSVISPTSPIRRHLTQPRPVVGSCSIGDGTPLEYIEKGMFNNTIDTTVVQNLKYDLFSSVSAAKLGLTSIIDYDTATGENQSYIVDKLTGNIIPLIERGQGILEVPLQLMTPRLLSDDHALAHPETILYAFDILKQLNERERDFLIHARLGHAPKRVILTMKKNGTKGLELYSGKYGELCKPCIQAKHRAENHGHAHTRHPNGLSGEHLHSDLAVVSTIDSNGNKYVLTVIDEVSSEVIVALLKTKTAEAVCGVSRQIQQIITARTGNKLRTWQFDRGSEFLNAMFDVWLRLDLGVEQRFSNVEHPWENGKAERSFQTIFALARSLLKHADLPNKMWGKAVLHAAYIMNRTPVSNTGGLAPLQFRTQEHLDLSDMRFSAVPPRSTCVPQFETTRSYRIVRLAAHLSATLLAEMGTSF